MHLWPWQLTRAPPAQNTPTRHLKCSTKPFAMQLYACALPKIGASKRFNPTPTPIPTTLSTITASSLLRRRQLSQAPPAQNTPTRHLKCPTNDLQCSSTSLQPLKLVHRITLTLQTPNGVHHNVANNYHVLRSEALAASTGTPGLNSANEASKVPYKWFTMQ